MSTTNTETLKLYKNTKLYNGSRYKVYQNNKTMEQYLGTAQYSKTVYYKSINEPIVINEFIKNCDEYTYGSITNEGKTYYFFVDSITTDAYKQTTINYTIDWWSTNWSKIDCTKAHITRQNKNKPLYIEQPISTKNMSITTQPLTNNFSIWATYIPSGENAPSFINYIVLDGTKDNIGFVDEGYWQNVLRIPHADIKDCFIVPYFTPHDINPDLSPSGFTIDSVNTFYAVNSALYEGNTHDDKMESAINSDLLNYVVVGDIVYDIGDGGYYECLTRPDYTFKRVYIEKDGKLKRYISNIYRLTQGGLIFPQYNYFYMFTIEDFKGKDFLVPPENNYRQFELIPQQLTFISTEKSRQGVSDWNGNSIWEAPVDENITFKIRLMLGLSHIMLEFTPVNSNNSQSIVGLSFSYDCRHPGLFVDSYQDYILKNRDYDISMRKIQSEKQEFQAWASTAENIGFGYAFGGAGTGAMRGATAAGVGGVVEAVSTTLMNNLFDPKIQAQYDLRYARMTDQISLVGDSITNLLNVLDENNGVLRRYSVNVSQSSSDRYDNDILVNGYYSDEETTDLGDMFSEGLIIQADNVVVEGACNLEGKRQVVQRLMNGVEFI